MQKESRENWERFLKNQEKNIVKSRRGVHNVHMRRHQIPECEDHIGSFPAGGRTNHEENLVERECRLSNLSSQLL